MFAVLVPSEAEGYGLAVLEALACDVPVLATNLEPLTDAQDRHDAVTQCRLRLRRHHGVVLAVQLTTLGTYTLPVGIAGFVGAISVDWGLSSAAATVSPTSGAVLTR